MSKNKRTVILLLILAVFLVISPLFFRKDADFGGSDDAGSIMVEEVQGETYEPWFTPVLETFLGGELPGEIESLIFCLQTGIGVGIIAFFMGRFVERKKMDEGYGSNRRLVFVSVRRLFPCHLLINYAIHPNCDIQMPERRSSSLCPLCASASSAVLSLWP